MWFEGYCSKSKHSVFTPRSSKMGFLETILLLFIGTLVLTYDVVAQRNEDDRNIFTDLGKIVQIDSIRLELEPSDSNSFGWKVLPEVYEQEGNAVEVNYILESVNNLENEAAPTPYLNQAIPVMHLNPNIKNQYSKSIPDFLQFLRGSQSSKHLTPEAGICYDAALQEVCPAATHCSKKNATLYSSCSSKFPFTRVKRSPQTESEQPYPSIDSAGFGDEMSMGGSNQYSGITNTDDVGNGPGQNTIRIYGSDRGSGFSKIETGSTPSGPSTYPMSSRFKRSAQTPINPGTGPIYPTRLKRNSPHPTAGPRHRHGHPMSTVRKKRSASATFSIADSSPTLKNLGSTPSIEPASPHSHYSIPASSASWGKYDP